MKTKKVYWAGDLFDFKDLCGNRLLADAFNARSCSRWQAVLPQENESSSERSGCIRDDDLEQLFSADAFVGNFDGHDLDSGSVVEFCFAKFLDLPAVLLRTDFRNSNDTKTCSDPWNLMCSGYPRTEVVLYHAMANSASLTFSAMADAIAEKVVQALDRTAALPPVFPDPEQRFSAFRNAVLAAGGSIRQRFPDERISRIAAERN